MRPAGESPQARAAHAEQAWARALTLFARADAAVPLAPADLELAAEAADLSGHTSEAIGFLRRAHLAYVEAGAAGPALRSGFWLCRAFEWSGDPDRASGWQARLAAFAAAAGPVPEQGYLSLLAAHRQSREGPPAALLATAERLIEQVADSDDADLRASAAAVHGLALIANLDAGAGLARLDDAMTAVADGGVSARATGMLHCVAIGACLGIHELGRAARWSRDLAARCDAQPEFRGAYRGVCRVYRAAVLVQTGGWAHAAREARLACAELTAGYGEAEAAAAFYQAGEAHRLRGALETPTGRTGRRWPAAGTSSPAWRCCAWPSAAPTRLRPASAAR